MAEPPDGATTVAASPDPAETAVAYPPDLLIDGIACRGARAMLGVSQTKLCEAAGIGRNMLNDFENGARTPHKRNARRIREVLEALGASFLSFHGAIVVAVGPEVASTRTPRARSIGGG